MENILMPPSGLKCDVCKKELGATGIHVQYHDSFEQIHEPEYWFCSDQCLVFNWTMKTE